MNADTPRCFRAANRISHRPFSAPPMRWSSRRRWSELCSSHCLLHSLYRSARVAENVRLPQPHDRPPRRAQQARVAAIACNIRCNLRGPVQRVRTASQLFAPRAPTAAVPEIAVAEDDYARATKDHVWLAGKLWGMQPIPQSSAPQLLSEQQFRLGVARAIPLLDPRCRLRGRFEAREPWNLRHRVSCRLL